jgi:hypothetical protein
MAIRTTRQYADVAGTGDAGKLRVSRQYVDVLGRGDGKLRVTRQMVEVLCSLPAGNEVSADATLVLNLGQSARAGFVRSLTAVTEIVGLGVEITRGVVEEASSELNLDATADHGPDTFHRRPSSAIGVAGSASFVPSWQKNLTSALDLGQSVNYVGPRSVSARSDITLSDSGRKAETWTASAKSFLNPGQSVARTGTTRVEASNALSLGQYADDSIFVRDAASQLSLASTATIDRIRRAVTVLNLGQSATEGFINLRAESTLNLDQIARPNPITIGWGPQFDKQLPPSELNLDQTARSNIRRLTVTSTLDLSQGVEVRRPYYLTAANAVQTVTQQYDYQTGTLVEVIEGLHDSAQRLVVTTYASRDRLFLADAAAVVRLKAGAIDLSAESVLNLDQDLFQNTTASAQTWIGLDQAAVGHASKLAEGVLSLTDAAVVTVSRDLSASNTLDIGQSFTYWMVDGGALTQYRPFVGAGAPGLPTPPKATLDGPVPGVTVPFQLLYPASGAVEDTITLRAPNLGNKDRLQFNRITRETRGGTLIVFADPIWPKIQTLVLQFSGLTQAESQGLLAFMEDHLGEEIGLIDWEHRYWRGVIVGVDDPAVQDGKHNYTMGFEFEGELDPNWTP